MAASRTELIDIIRRSMGNSMIDIELDPEDYHLAIDKALEQFRQQSENATEESFMFLDMQQDVNTYFLPKEVIEVKMLFRRSVGVPGASGTEFDPFELAYTNAYILQAGTVGGGVGGLATYDFFTIYQEELGKMFGYFLDFVWSEDTNKLQIIRRSLGIETIMLAVHNEKPELVLLDGRYTGPWLRDWAIAECKEMLGQAYRKYSNIPGPSGGTNLPGPELLAEAAEAKTELRERLRNYESGERPATFVIG